MVLHVLTECWMMELGCGGAAKYDPVVKIELFAKVLGLMVQDCRSQTTFLYLPMEHGV